MRGACGPRGGAGQRSARRAARRRGVAASNSAAFSGQCASPQPLEPATVGAVLRGRVRVTAGAGPDRQPRPTAGAACPCMAGGMHFTQSNSCYAVKLTLTLFTQLNAPKHLLRRKTHFTQRNSLYAFYAELLMVTLLYACIFILTHLTLYATGCSLRTSTHPNSIYAA